jgi:hypothetical protein
MQRRERQRRERETGLGEEEEEPGGDLIRREGKAAKGACMLALTGRVHLPLFSKDSISTNQSKSK